MTNEYRPTKLKVGRLGINITDGLNSNLSLTPSEYLIVGEHTNNQLSLIVDSEGFAVNSTLASRAINRPDFAGEIYGNTFIDGNLVVSGLINGSNIFGTTSGAGSNFWRYALDTNIYYDGNVTIGKVFDATSNAYTLNIAESANYIIDKSQLAIQNRQGSVFRASILGEADVSPIILNSVPNTPIEFHAGRDQTYFDSVYTRNYIDLEGQPAVEHLDIPNYTHSSNYPHLNIDINGNVGIKTNYNNEISYVSRRKEQGSVIYTNVSDKSSLHIEGSTYSREILMYDYETETPKHLDDLYIRRIGVSIDASNIIAGNFANGEFAFSCNLTVQGNLTVNGNTEMSCNLNVNGELVGSTMLMNADASFSNNIVVQNNIYFKANLFKQRIDPETGSNSWDMIQFNSNSFETPSLSNLYWIGNGVATRGRLGVGAQPSLDQVNNQNVIIKRDATIFELELTDKRQYNYQRTAFIGHPQVSADYPNDGSIVFVTPKNTDTNFNSPSPYAQQNIYFYAGGGVSNYLTEFKIETCNIPTLGVFTNHRVGINTFSPSKTLDVVGDIAITNGDLYIKQVGSLSPSKIAIWKEQVYTSSSLCNYTGITYNNSSAPHCGINTSPLINYGLVVSGKILSRDGYFTGSGVGNRIVPIYESCNMIGKAIPAYETMYANGRIGFGVLQPEGTLHLQDTAGMTKFKLSQGTASSNTMIHFNGASTNYVLNLNDTSNTFELYCGTFTGTVLNSNTNRPFLTRCNISGVHQVIINSNLSFAEGKPLNTALFVNGDVEINGDINITGNYSVSGNTIVITGSSQAEYYSNINTLENDNIYIAGNDIFMNMNKSCNSSLYIGWGGVTNDELPFHTGESLIDKPAVYIRNTNSNSRFIVDYKSSTGTCLNKYSTSTGGSDLLIGLTQTLGMLIGKTERSAYIVAKDFNNNYSLGIGTISPNEAKVHICSEDASQSILYISRDVDIPDNVNIVADINLEKKVSNGEHSYAWKIQGPNMGFRQKLQFMYSEDNSTPIEIVSFTSNGCIGIGNTQPEYAIDIITTGNGSIRMIQGNDTPTPQIMFQSDINSTETSFGMYAFNDIFTLNSTSNLVEKKLLNFDVNNTLGIFGDANSNFNVSINGTLNITDGVYMAGEQFFTTCNLIGSGLSGIFSWQNIIFDPNPLVYGGVTINGNTFTSNIFHINSGQNGNLGVFNSAFENSYIHFRNRTPSYDASLNSTICRVGLHQFSHIVDFSYDTNSNISYISDCNDGFVRATELYFDAEKTQFVQRIYGSILLQEDDTVLFPSTDISFNNEGNKIGATSDNNMYILTSNLGIGEEYPTSKLHLLNEEEVVGFTLNHTNTSCNILTITNHTQNEKFVILANGYVGIGTNTPPNPLHVEGTTSIHGSVGIGTNIPSTALHIIGTATIVNTTDPYALNISGNSYFSSNVNIQGSGYVLGNFEVGGNFINESDRSIKHDIEPIENALSKIKQLSGYTFLKRDYDRRETGVIAQEVQKVLPEAVFETADGILGVAYGNLVGLLIESIKELSNKIDELKK